MTMWSQNQSVENHCCKIFEINIQQDWTEMLSGPMGSNGNSLGGSLTKES